MERKILEKVPFINRIPSDGRIIFLQPVFDKDDSHFKLYTQQGTELIWVYAEPYDVRIS